MASFYIPESYIVDNIWSNENDLMELIRSHSNDDVKEVKLIDKFHNTNLNKYSRAYRITYSAINPDMKNPAEFKKYVNDIHNELGKKVITLNVELR